MRLLVNLLNEVDHVILYGILTERSNRVTIPRVKEIIDPFYPILYNKPIAPGYTYFYQRINRMRELSFLEKQGSKTYRINRENYSVIKKYVLEYMNLKFDIRDGKIEQKEWKRELGI